MSTDQKPCGNAGCFCHLLAASPQPAAQPEQPEPGGLTDRGGYGATDWGYPIAGISVADGDKRLMAMLVHALGSEHPAIDDLVSLLFRAAGSITRKRSDAEVARIMEAHDRAAAIAIRGNPRDYTNAELVDAANARAEVERLVRGEA